MLDELESDRAERKEAWAGSAPDKCRQAVCAFANDLPNHNQPGNRSALIATDHVVIPLAVDLFSLQGLRNLGPTLRGWRADWNKRAQSIP